MGRVVEAFDTQLGRTVALKEVLPKGAGVEKRFAREVQITARLEHPAIVPLYDSGTTVEGLPFYVMRRVTGRPLDELIRRAPNLGERLVLLPNVLAAIDAVAHAHRRGVIHRDLKPANILVGEHGETVVIDWGLAKVIGEEDREAGNAISIPTSGDSLQTQIGSVFGTPGFMAPEQVRAATVPRHPQRRNGARRDAVSAPRRRASARGHERHRGARTNAQARGHAPRGDGARRAGRASWPSSTRRSIPRRDTRMRGRASPRTCAASSRGSSWPPTTTLPARSSDGSPGVTEPR